MPSLVSFSFRNYSVALHLVTESMLMLAFARMTIDIGLWLLDCQCYLFPCFCHMSKQQVDLSVLGIDRCIGN
jgi:hypothetical protein